MGANAIFYTESLCSTAVFMGMGEPLLNLPSVMRAHTMLNENLGVGQRHITISTVGVPNAIMKLASHNLQSTLAISIHAPNQQLREQLVPRYPTLHALSVLSVCTVCLSVLAVCTVCLYCTICLSVCIACLRCLSAVALCMHWVFDTAPVAKIALGAIYHACC